MGSLLSLGIRNRLDHRQAVLYTDQITDFLKCDPGPSEVSELFLSIDGGGIEDYMIMDMSAIGMSRNNEGILTFGKSC